MPKYSITVVAALWLTLLALPALAQMDWVSGRILRMGSGEPIPGASISVLPEGRGVISTGTGGFRIEASPADSLLVTAIGYEPWRVMVQELPSAIYLRPAARGMDEVVVTGTMRAVQRSASPVPVEVYSPQFFRKNPTPSIFDALQLVNGVRPQLNCNVCNTGDIHINGLEGPYTMVLIDGMPIVSSLASVYGLQGIPNALVERIEIVKGPAASLYGSEAIGGLINVITKNPAKAPAVALEYSGTSWREHNLDAGIRYRAGKKANGLLGINYFNFTHRYDKNKDNFTDVTLQNRFSLFQKISWQRKENRQAALALRFITEDRWGGEMQWTRAFRGGDSIYGEQISTLRTELIGNYQLPVAEKILFSYSANSHRQRSAYGNTLFNAEQHIGYAQLTWEKALGSHHQLLSGIVGRYTWYDDNSPATATPSGNGNRPDKVFLPGIFLQDEIELSADHNLLAGLRFDHDSRHGGIWTPRLAWKWQLSGNDHLRLNAGSGFRVVNLFTEEHAALTGAREVIIEGDLQPEQSYNANLNYTRKLVFNRGWVNLEAAAWYTWFRNRILPDYTTNTDAIIYRNLDGYAESKGFSLNMESSLGSRLRLTAGLTLQEVSVTEKLADGSKTTQRQILTEPWSGTWTLTYILGKSGWSADYTGSIYGPMDLPLLSALDPRKPISPVWSLQHIQVTRKLSNGLEFFGGVKNLLDFTPAKNNPFIIARANDPFDKTVERNADGHIVPSAGNPYGLSFDPNYVYAPNQGRKFFLGLRYTHQ